jgi:hypothetical protein
MLTVCFCCECCCAVRNGLRVGPQEFLDILVRLPGRKKPAMLHSSAMTPELRDDLVGWP